jgi:Concanavalin A-like lectin/glucanases superfamily
LLRKITVLGALVGVLMLTFATAAGAALTGAQWLMDEPSGQMLDTSGNNNHGTPVDVIQTGTGYIFNGSTSHVAVPDSDSLDPQERDITLRARVLVNNVAMDDDSYDVVRKGLSGRRGGHYKMEIKGTANPTVGKLQCVFGGDRGTVKKVAQRDVVDGEFHTLECVKTSTSVVARVDGSSSTQSGRAGLISNTSNVLVGAKTNNPPDDMFYGEMDYVSIVIP